jgi:PadR family transcriptional regulator PadR
VGSLQIDKTLLSGSTAMLIMKLLEKQDMYGYQMIEQLKLRSDSTFELKAGTLYPLLHTLEQKGYICAKEASADSVHPRRYYHLTDDGHLALWEKQSQWEMYAAAVKKVLSGGGSLA